MCTSWCVDDVSWTMPLVASLVSWALWAAPIRSRDGAAPCRHARQTRDRSTGTATAHTTRIRHPAQAASRIGLFVQLRLARSILYLDQRGLLFSLVYRCISLWTVVHTRHCREPEIDRGVQRPRPETVKRHPHIGLREHGTAVHCSVQDLLHHSKKVPRLL